jgi:mannose-1-phosphate guanylyltransferase
MVVVPADREGEMSDRTWVIVLAGGEGTRIQPLIRRCLGFSCPKQYFTFCGKRSMLENTVDRAAQLVGPERVITVIGKGHRRFLKHQNIQGTVLEQPSSRGTGAGVFLPAAHILARDPEATVLIFPSDHFVSPKEEFLDQVNHARECVDHLDNKLILMAAVPDMPETDYGWVEPGDGLTALKGNGKAVIREVRSFREKPCAEEARRCFERGYLWNTMIIAARLRALWRLGKQILPQVIDNFESFCPVYSGNAGRTRREERAAVAKLYRSIPGFDFSSTFLTQGAGHCAVMPLHGILWSDWGRPERVFDSLRRIGRKPQFLEAALRWQRNRRLQTKIGSPAYAQTP